MPFIHVEYSAGSADEQQKENLIARITEVVADELGKDKSKIYVVLNEIPAAHLGAGGMSLAKKRRTA